MNIKNLKRLRTWLRSRKNPVAFNMAQWFKHDLTSLSYRDSILDVVKTHPCRTVACLAGHAAILEWEDPKSPISGGMEISNTAAESLGLTRGQADHLFLGRWSSKTRVYGGLTNISKAETIRELTRLIEHEEARAS